MDKIKIKKVKLIKGENLSVSYEKTEADNSKTEVTENHNATVHPDLLNAFHPLAGHLAIIAGFIDGVESIAAIDPLDLTDYHVRAYSVGGAEDEEGIVLSGHKIL